MAITLHQVVCELAWFISKRERVHKQLQGSTVTVIQRKLPRLPLALNGTKASKWLPSAVWKALLGTPGCPLGKHAVCALDSTASFSPE